MVECPDDEAAIEDAKRRAHQHPIEIWDLARKVARVNLSELPMPAFLYRCPVTDYRVQAFIAEEVSDTEELVLITCAICGQVHLVNPMMGKVTGSDVEY